MAIHVVVGGQYGSEGKGAFTAALTAKLKGERNAAIRVGGPNAGHTVIDNMGREWKLRQVPVAAVVDPACALYIAAGSEIDLEVLDYEVAMLDAAGFAVTPRLWVDDSATLITDADSAAEHGLVQRIGSTGKGIGAARAARINREAELYGSRYHGVDVLHRLRMTRPENIIIEGTQGYGLGLHAGYYPFCTSRDCRAIDFLAEVGISPWEPASWHGPTNVWVVFRPYPIRVAGNSGPMYKELTWEQLAERHGHHIQPEHTTVTQKVRRVGEWDPTLAADAIKGNGGPSRFVRPVMMMADYVVPDIHGATDLWAADEEAKQKLNEYSSIWGTVIGQIAAYGTGPRTVAWIERA